MLFVAGKEYTRTEIRKIVNDPGSNGKWVRGYCQHNEEYFIFCNINGESYTGVDHHNYWLSDMQLSWNAVKKSKQSHLSLKKMLSDEATVHIFTRDSNQNKKNFKGAPFIYRGIGKPELIEGEEPVHVIWNVEDSMLNKDSEIDSELNDDMKYLLKIEESLNRYMPIKTDSVDSPDKYNDSGETTVETVKIKRNYKIAINAIVNANFQCEIDENHQSFISKRYNKQYVEAHHIVPLSFQKEYDYSLDKEANIVALCPNCHRTIHHGIKSEREVKLKKIYELRSERLKMVGIDTDFGELINMYN